MYICFEHIRLKLKMRFIYLFIFISILSIRAENLWNSWNSKRTGKSVFVLFFYGFCFWICLMFPLHSHPREQYIQSGGQTILFNKHLSWIVLGQYSTGSFLVTLHSSYIMPIARKYCTYFSRPLFTHGSSKASKHHMTC